MILKRRAAAFQSGARSWVRRRGSPRPMRARASSARMAGEETPANSARASRSAIWRSSAAAISGWRDRPAARMARVLGSPDSIAFDAKLFLPFSIDLAGQPLGVMFLGKPARDRALEHGGDGFAHHRVDRHEVDVQYEKQHGRDDRQVMDDHAGQEYVRRH